MDLTINEKRILAALNGSGPINAKILAEKMDATLESVIQWAHLCADKDLLTLEKTVVEQAKLTVEGEKYAKEGLPERQIVSTIKGSIPMNELTSHSLSKIAIGWLRKKNWVTIKDGIVHFNENFALGEDELALKNPIPGTKACKELEKRGHIIKVEQDRTHFGRGQIILKLDNGVYAAGTESRTDSNLAVY